MPPDDPHGSVPDEREIVVVAREGLQRILDMGCPFGREGDLLGDAQKIASETITKLVALACVRDARRDTVAVEDVRQAALELQAAIRDGLAWIDRGAEPTVAYHQMRKCADKWYPTLTDDEP